MLMMPCYSPTALLSGRTSCFEACIEECFDEAAHTMGLNTSWSKTKIQNLGHGVTPACQDRGAALPFI